MGIHHWPFWHRPHFPDGYTSPFLLEILSSKNQGAWPIATGSLTAEAPGKQVVSCSRAASGYCLGSDGLLHLLGANTVRVEPAGLLVEGASTNWALSSQAIGDARWTSFQLVVAAPVITLSSTDVLDPAGGNTATKITYPAIGAGQYSFVAQNTGASRNGTQSVWLRTLSGTATVYLTDDTAGTFTTCNVTSTWQRFSGSATGGATYFELGGYAAAPVNTPTMAACTVYAWQAQLESLPFCTSAIPTTSAAASRDADIVSVPSPLASLGQPVPAWRMGATHVPLAPWAVLPNFGSMSTLALYPGAFANFADLNGPNALRTLDGAGASQFCTVTAPTASNPFTLVGRDTSGGAMSTVPAGSLSGAGTGIVATMPSTLNIGTPPWAPNFGFWGHMTDVLVDNT